MNGKSFSLGKAVRVLTAEKAQNLGKDARARKIPSQAALMRIFRLYLPKTVSIIGKPKPAKRFIYILLWYVLGRQNRMQIEDILV